MKKALLSICILSLFSFGGLSAQKLDLQFSDLAEMPINMVGMSTVTDGEVIYAINGNTRGEHNAWKFDPFLNEWKKWELDLAGKWAANAEFIPETGFIYALNGMMFKTNELFKEQFNNRIEVINPRTGTVKILDTHTPNPVFSGGSAVWDGKLYVFGGSSGHDRSNIEHFSNQLWVFDPATESWEQLADMPEPKQTDGAIVNGILYTFGGFNGTASNRIDAYDIKHGHWYYVGPMEEAIRGHSLVTQGEKIWLQGSIDNPDFLAVFDTESEYITPVESNISGRFNAGSAILKGQFYTFGGTEKSPCVGTKRSTQVTTLGQSMAASEAETAQADFEVYPNPTKGGFNILVKSGTPVQFTLSTVSGEILFRNTISPGADPLYVNLPELAKGVYIAGIETENGIISKRVVIL